MESSTLPTDPARLPSKTPPRPIYNRNRSQHGLSSFDPSPMDRIALDGTRTLGPSSLTVARSFEDMYAGTTETASSRTSSSSTAATATAVATAVGGKGSLKETGTGSSKQGGAIDRKHFSSTVSNSSRKRKNSHSRGDIEFWASLYAQHSVYTRQATKTTSESPMSSSGAPSASNNNHYSNDHKGASTRAPIKIWQVLTKTELDQHPGKHHRSRTKHESHESFQFERLPIKAPTTASTATATALSSNGRPFSIVFFFTIETSANPVDSVEKSKSKSRSRSRSKSSSSQAAATTLWYFETAYTRLRTLHEHMELMGDFLPNGSNPADGREVTPIYIYETQKLNFEQPRDQDEAVVLDLKLQSPEGAVYAEFSYTFVKDVRPEDAIPDSSRKIDITLKSKSSRLSKNGRSKMAQTISSRESAEHDLESDEDFLVEKPGAKDPVLDVVAEEPDAGEHFMQATSQFFSKMGYWLYNSKVVQYIARDDRVRTKTAFPADDIWMLGVCYQFLQEFPVEEKPLVVAANDIIETNTKVADDHPQDGSQALGPNPTTKSNSTLDSVPAETPSLTPTLASDPIPAATKEMAHSSTSAPQATSALNSPKTDQMSPERARYSRKMTLSQFATNPSQRSAPTSSISTQEAQSHSHSRSASTNTTSALLGDEFNIKSVSNSSRTRTLSHSAATSSKLSSTSSSGNSKSAIATMATKLSNMSISPKNSQSILKEEAPQRDGTLVGGMASALGQERDQVQEQPTSTGRKPGRRRMTISELFTWDSNSSSGTKRNSAGSSNGSSSNSVSALKSLVGSSKSGLASTTLPVESNTKQKQPPLVLAETGKAKDVTIMVSSNDLINPNSPQPQVQNQAITSDNHAPNQTASELGFASPATTPRQRERRRKTSSHNMVSRQDPALSSPPPSDSPRPAYDEGVILTPTPRSPSMGRDFIPRASSPPPLPSPLRSSAFTGKRQSSMPISPTSSRTNKRADGSAPSSPSPPPSPSPLISPSSPGLSIKRSWRSLSLSLASTAKSALPSGLTSPIRPRSSLAFDSQQRKQYNHGAGFGHDYDGDDYDYSQDNNTNNSALISLPPAVVTAMSLQRPPPSWSAAAFKSLSPEQKVLRQFLMDFQSRLWFTYRKDLARIEPSFYTCDSGWGCMMRTGQSLLAQAFVQVLLGREWRAHLPQKQYSERRYGEILDWFVDEPDRPYSIHRIAKAGLALDKRIGEWFGPSTVAHAIKRLSQHHADCPLAVLVPMDNSVRVSSIVQAATLSQAQMEAQMMPPKTITSWRPVLLLIPTRYGLEKLTEKYIPNLKQLFRMPQFMGIAGGRPGRSLYFVACQGEELYYYDPHFVKPRVTTDELDCCPAPSFHCPVVRSMDILELDPSMLLGFLIQSPEELQDLRKRLLGPDMNQGYPLLAIQNDYDLEQGIAGDNDDTSPNKDILPEPDKVNNTQQDGAQVLSSSPDQFIGNAKQHGKADGAHEIDNEDVFSIKSLESDAEEENEGGMIEKGENEDDDDDDEGVLV
ncbi:Cysteine protease atg4b [Mortierella sp. AD094]|nr:Cysteine protease atg4b [Mortierella sp. AD094]